MDLAVYMMTATIVVFMLGAAIALGIAIASGQFKNLDAASCLVLEDDDPMPTRWDGDR
jgi:nitrogen fixation-related uncharacterized protein